MDTHQLETFAELATKAIGTEIKNIDLSVGEGNTVPVLVVDDGRKAIDVTPFLASYEKLQATPFRRRGIFRAADVKSLLSWLDANTENSAPVFGEGAENLGTNWKLPKLALIGIGNYAQRRDAAWHDFAGRYDFPVAEPFKVWAAKHGEWFEQAEFAEFIESRLYDLASPASGESTGEAVNRFLELIGSDRKDTKVATPAKLFELSRGLKLTATSKLEQKINLHSGEATIVYSEQHTGSGDNPIKVPNMFYVRIPVFFGQAPTLIGALLRYRAHGGTVKWSYELFAPDLVVKEQFEAACVAVERAGRTLYLGTPDKP
jgi:uncharacterized protein YfdQ (DUF2303 family)